MKNYKTIVILLLMLSIGAMSGTMIQAAGPRKTESFKVWGKCSMCKERIESTVKKEGVTEALWDQKTMMLTVTYDPALTNREKLSKKLAEVGHDTEKFRAPDDVYESLPACCHYERRK